MATEHMWEALSLEWDLSEILEHGEYQLYFQKTKLLETKYPLKLRLSRAITSLSTF